MSPPDQTLIDAITTGTEDAITLTSAAKLPAMTRDGRPASIAKVYRLASVGVSGVRLETCRVGGSIVTSREAVARFAAASNARRTNRPRATPPASTPAHRSAVAALASAGLL